MSEDNTPALATGSSIYSAQRTADGKRYERYVSTIRQELRSNPEMRRQLGKELMAIRANGGVTPSEVHANTIISSMSVQYKNDEYIGERFMPVVSVSKRSDSYAIYPKRERLAFPDDSIGARAMANELSETRTTDNYSVKDYALQNFVDRETVENQDAAFDEMMDLVDSINEGMAFRRELRIATILTTAGNYAGNTVTLSGADQWNSGSGGDPIKVIQDARAACWMGRGPGDLVAFCSLDIWNVLSRHAQIRDLFKYNREGLAFPKQLAQYLGLSDIVVGSPRQDTANSGQTASYSRIWGDYFGIVRVARRPTLRNASFGYTMRLQGDPLTYQWFDQTVGKGGGYYAKVAVSEDHKVVAGDTSFLIVDCLA